MGLNFSIPRRVSPYVPAPMPGVVNLVPGLSLSLTGDADNGWTPAKLREFADNTVINRVKSVPSVSSVVAFGGYRRQMQVLIDRSKLAAYRLSILDVRNAIDRFNVSRSG